MRRKLLSFQMIFFPARPGRTASWWGVASTCGRQQNNHDAALVMEGVSALFGANCRRGAERCFSGPLK